MAQVSAQCQTKQVLAGGRMLRSCCGQLAGAAKEQTAVVLLPATPCPYAWGYGPKTRDPFQQGDRSSCSDWERRGAATKEQTAAAVLLAAVPSPNSSLRMVKRLINVAIVNSAQTCAARAALHTSFRPALHVASHLASPVEGSKQRDHNATHILRSYLQVLMAFAA